MTTYDHLGLKEKHIAQICTAHKTMQGLNRVRGMLLFENFSNTAIFKFVVCKYVERLQGRGDNFLYCIF